MVAEFFSNIEDFIDCFLVVLDMSTMLSALEFLMSHLISMVSVCAIYHCALCFYSGQQSVLCDWSTSAWADLNPKAL